MYYDIRKAYRHRELCNTKLPPIPVTLVIGPSTLGIPSTLRLSIAANSHIPKSLLESEHQIESSPAYTLDLVTP